MMTKYTLNFILDFPTILGILQKRLNCPTCEDVQNYVFFAYKIIDQAKMRDIFAEGLQSYTNQSLLIDKLEKVPCKDQLCISDISRHVPCLSLLLLPKMWYYKQ